MHNDWLQWANLVLNVLLLPALAALWHISGTLSEIKVKIDAHAELDVERFKAIDRRLENLEN